MKQTEQEIDFEVPEMDIMGQLAPANQDSFFELLSEEPEEESPQDFDDQAESPGFQANLAEYIDDYELDALSSNLMKKVQEDIDSREPWFEMVRDVVKELGISDRPDEGMEKFPGELSLTFPIFMRSQVQFYSRIIPEIFTSNPVTSQVKGQSNPDFEAQAKRVEDFMNYQITYADPDNKKDFRKMIWWLGVAGSMFRRCFFDPLTNKVKSRLVKAEDFVVPFDTVSLETARRFTHILTENKNETKKLQKNGFYRDVELAFDSIIGDDESNTLDDIKAVSDGMNNEYSDESDVSKIYYIHTYLDIKGFEDTDEYGEPTGIELPYLVCIHEPSKKILSIRRNWKENDTYKTMRINYAHYKFQEGFGFYGSGYYHLVGTLQRAATGAMRAFNGLLAFSLGPIGFKLKDSGISGDMTFRAGEFKDVDISITDLDKAFKIIDFPQPSSLVLEYVKMLGQEAQSIMSTQDLMTGNTTPVNAPMTSTLAMLEQAQKVSTAQHQSIRESFNDEIKIIYDLNYDFLPDEQYFLTPGNEGYVRRSDFDSRIDVVPTSDPSVASFQLRMATDQAALDMRNMFPEMFKENGQALARRVLENMKVTNLSEIVYSPEEMEQRMAEMQANTPPPIEQVQLDLINKEMEMRAQIEQMKQQIDVMKLELENKKIETNAVLKNKEIDQKQGVITNSSMITEDYIQGVVRNLLESMAAQQLQEQQERMMQLQQQQMQQQATPQPSPEQQQAEMEMAQQEADPQRQSFLRRLVSRFTREA